ncbi:MAG: NADH-quinone oxidoreductase subunit K [Micrococcaceae bacterium]
MSINLLLILVMMVLFGVGIFLVLDRGLTRILLGLVMLGNGANILLLLTGGAPASAAFYIKDWVPNDYSDPLPQAFILTSIVITFSVVAFMMALSYRSWMLAQEDMLRDDIEDLRVADIGHYDEEGDTK